MGDQTARPATQREVIDQTYWQPRKLDIDSHIATATNIGYGTTAIVCACKVTAVSSSDEKASRIVHRKHLKNAREDIAERLPATVPEIIDYALGFYPHGVRVDWDDLLYRIESVFGIDLPENMLDPIVQVLKSEITKARKESGE